MGEACEQAAKQAVEERGMAAMRGMSCFVCAAQGGSRWWWWCVVVCGARWQKWKAQLETGDEREKYISACTAAARWR